MLVVQETTNWETPNHIYFLNNDRTKMFAYIADGEEKGQIFKNPIDFYSRGRTFELIKQVAGVTPSIAVKGSKGDVYYVSRVDGRLSCTCAGFVYRGECKHAKES